MRRLEANTKDKDLNLLVIGGFLTLILVLIPSSAVFAQSPWGLFQKLCPSGLLATGPQCANLFTGTNIGTCDPNLLNTYGVCIPTTTGTCPANYQLQNGVPTVSLTGANTATPTFQAPIVVNQTPLVFSLTVTDSLGQVSAPVSVTVIATPS